MADFEIEIRNVNGEAVPQNIPAVIGLGKTVHYSSPDGEVIIVFPLQSPFRNDHVMGTFVTDSQVVTTMQSTPQSGFPCRCFIRPKGQRDFIGWKADPSPSGGNHVVH
jgi:hypothetical protein